MEITGSELQEMDRINGFFKIYKPIPPIFFIELLHLQIITKITTIIRKRW